MTDVLTLARKAIARPGYAFKAAGRQLRATPMPAPEARPFIAERLATLREAFNGVTGQTVRGQGFGHGAVLSPHAELLWRLVKTLRPARVVETGVCNGLSSAVLLEAMDGYGDLISVDLPEYADEARNTESMWEGKGGAVVPPGKDAGWLVPEHRRGRWRLVLGRASEYLPAILNEAPVDLFIHDSEHSFENQLFEFSAGWMALAPGGVLVATDVNWSDAFDTFRGIAQPRVQWIDHTCALAFKPR